MVTLETTLTSVDPARPRTYRVVLDGRRLVRTAQAAGRRPRETVTELDVADDDAAERAFAKARDAKLRDGFSRIAGPDAAALPGGATVLEAASPDRTTAYCVDLSPDGRTVAVGSARRDAHGAEFHLIDVATGRTRLALAVPPFGAGARTRQTFPQAVLFDADGRRLVCAVNGHTRVVDTDASDGPDALAAYQQFGDARFNHFRVRPRFDATRRRLLVFDGGDRVRVLDAADDWRPLLDLATGEDPLEVVHGALSPSGALLALLRTTPLGSPDRPPRTEVEIWDVDAGALRDRMPMPSPDDASREVDRIGFDPTERVLVTGRRGPNGWAIPSGDPLWAHTLKFWDDGRPDHCHGWAYSPDGGLLAVGRRHGVELLDARTHEPAPDHAHDPATGPTGRTDSVVFSADGTLLATAGDYGRIVVRRV